MESEHRLAANSGCEVISGTGNKTARRFFGFVANSDCVLTSMTTSNSNGDGLGDDATAVTTMGLTSVTIKSGIYVAVPSDKVISQIQLASGSIVAYKV